MCVAVLVLLVAITVDVDQHIEAGRICRATRRNREQLVDLVNNATRPITIDLSQVPDVSTREWILVENQRHADFRAYALSKLPPVTC